MKVIFKTFRTSDTHSKVRELEIRITDHFKKHKYCPVCGNKRCIQNKNDIKIIFCSYCLVYITYNHYTQSFSVIPCFCFTYFKFSRHYYNNITFVDGINSIIRPVCQDEFNKIKNIIHNTYDVYMHAKSFPYKGGL